jgi:hypothetical protein
MASAASGRGMVRVGRQFAPGWTQDQPAARSRGRSPGRAADVSVRRFYATQRTGTTWWASSGTSTCDATTYATPGAHGERRYRPDVSHTFRLRTAHSAQRVEPVSYLAATRTCGVLTCALRVRSGPLVAVVLVLVQLPWKSVVVRRCSPAWLLGWLLGKGRRPSRGAERRRRRPALAGL